MNYHYQISNKILPICLLLVLSLIVLSIPITLAQNNEIDDIQRANDIKRNASEQELQAIAIQIYNDQITPEFTDLLYHTLSPYQRNVITMKIAELTNVSFDELLKEIERNSNRNSNIENLPLSPGYNIQMPHATGGSLIVSISSYSLDPLCDNDPSDDDWKFFANTPQTVNPPAMRWYATQALVTWALNTAYGGMLSTYGYHLHQINVCLGTNGVLLAGGANNVFNHLKVRYR